MLSSCLSLAVSLSLSSPAPAPAWELIKEEEGIRVFRKEMPGSSLVAFRGEGMVTARLGSVVAVFFTEMERAPEWVAMLEKTKMLARPQFYEFTLWDHFDNPWPVTDRDFVYRGVGKADPESKTFTIRYKSVVRPEMPEQSCCVRGEILNTYFRFTATPDGSTLVECEVSLDPKGWLPGWMVNLVQKDWPSTTIASIRSQVVKPYVKELPEFASWY